VIESTRRGPRTPASVPVSRGSSRPWGDFASRDEWLKHRDRPALRPGDGHDIDWDSEARRLFGE